MQIKLSNEELEHYNSLPAQPSQFQQVWPFPISDGARTLQSQELLDTKQKHARIKPDLYNDLVSRYLWDTEQLEALL